MKELSPEVQIKYDALSDSIRNVTLAGRFFGHFSATELEKQRLKLIKKSHKKAGTGDLVQALSVASSTYYDASTHAWAQFRLKPFDFRWLINLRWLWRAVWCLAWASLYSNDMVRLAGGLEALSADQLDIRASICRQWRYYGEAEECVKILAERPR